MRYRVTQVLTFPFHVYTQACLTQLFLLCQQPQKLSKLTKGQLETLAVLPAHSHSFILAPFFSFLCKLFPHTLLSSVQFSHSVVSDSLQPHELQHTRPGCCIHAGCPSPTPGVYSNSCPLSQWCHPAISSSVVPLSSCPQSFPALGSFPMSALRIRWPKYCSFNFSISPSNEYSGLICFRMDWLDLLAAQGTLKSLLQHHSSKASILQCSAFFTVQLSHPYMITGKTIALTRQTFVDKVMSLLFNKLSRLVITFLPRSKHLLISWLQSPSAVILEHRKIKSVTVSTVSPSICH